LSGTTTAGRKICDQTIDEIYWMEGVSMKRRETLKLFGAAAVAAAIGVAGIPGLAFAQNQKRMVTAVKIAGIPWFNALENDAKKAGRDFGTDASVVGPAHQVEEIIIVNKDTVNGLIKQGL
jgi:ABC-type sugar transport system substrate-binding protein